MSVKQNSVIPNLQTTDIPAFHEGELLILPEQGHVDITVPRMNTEYHVFSNAPGVSYSARRLMFGVLAFWSTAASGKPCAVLWLPLQGGGKWCSLHPSLETGLRCLPLCMLQLCNCEPCNLEDHAVLETQAVRGPERPLEWGARTAEHTQRVCRGSDSGGLLPLYSGLVYQNPPASAATCFLG